MPVDLKDGLSPLERALERYIENSQNTLDSLSREMREFKDEMKEFKDEIQSDTKSLTKKMKEFKDEIQSDTKSLTKEMKEFKDEIRSDTKSLKKGMKEFKDEIQSDTKSLKKGMKESKDEIQSDTKSLKKEMKEFKDEMEKDHREMNRQWVNLAIRTGGLVTDIFIPGVKETVPKYFDNEITCFSAGIYIRNRETGEEDEFDVIAVTDLYVFVVEVETTPNNRDVDRLITKIVPKFRRLAPNYEDKIAIPILGSLSFPSKMIPYASKAGVYLLGYREWDYLDFLNFDEVERLK